MKDIYLVGKRKPGKKQYKFSAAYTTEAAAKAQQTRLVKAGFDTRLTYAMPYMTKHKSVSRYKGGGA